MPAFKYGHKPYIDIVRGNGEQRGNGDNHQKRLIKLKNRIQNG
jgi:hypothetical protein